jgi:hypothetical protein
MRVKDADILENVQRKNPLSNTSGDKADVATWRIRVATGFVTASCAGSCFKGLGLFNPEYFEKGAREGGKSTGAQVLATFGYGMSSSM